MQRRSVEDGRQHTVTAIAGALDQELRATSAALEALALSRSTDAIDIAALRTAALAVKREHPGWAAIAVTSDEGRSNIDLLDAKQLPPGDLSRIAAEALAAGSPKVSAGARRLGYRCAHPARRRFLANLNDSSAVANAGRRAPTAAVGSRAA